MLIKFLKQVLFIMAILAAQVALVPNLPGLENLNPALVALIFCAVVYRFNLAAVYGIILGLLLDLYSALPFGAMLIGLMLTLYLIYKVYERFLTNKSFYTLLGLMALATVVYNLIIYFYSVVFTFWQMKDAALIKQMTVFAVNNFLWQMALNLVLTILIFAVFHLVSRRFKAVFIDTTR